MKSILIVEDDADVRSVLEHVLVAAGYSVESAPSAAVARDRLDARPFDLVIADGKLGDGTGFEIADLAAAKGAKTLILSGYAMPFTKGELERHPFLMKPVRPVEIVANVMRLIGRD